MTSAPEQLDLAAGFPAARRDQWRALVAAVLDKSKRPYDADQPELALTSTTYDGITIAPLYTADDVAPAAGMPGLSPFTRGASAQGAVAGGWDVRAGYTEADPAALNTAVHDDLENGVSSLWLAVGTGGLPPSGLATALDGVLLDLAPIVLSPGTDYRAAAEALLALYGERGIPASEVRAVFGIDPISTLASTGAEVDIAEAATFAAEVAAAHQNAHAITVDATPYHEAGGSDAQELGCSIAAGVAYLRALTEAGMEPAAAAATLEFRYAATADQFATIAKLRAARRMWARVCEVSGIDEQAAAQTQHAVTSSAMMTARDPWVNMLRTTIAAFSAGIAGAGAVTVRPFDACIGVSDPFARRIARNTHAILLEESHLAGVIDPAGGSHFVERFSAELAERGWEVFTGIESAGGIVSALDSGLIAEQLAEVAAKRADNIAHRKDPITGVSEFPNLDEKPLSRKAFPADAATGGLPSIRYAGEFEALRDRSDANSERPTVFLATLGALAEYTARAGFARNLYAAGGIGCQEAGPTDEVADVVAALEKSGAKVVCVCGTEKAYAAQLAELVPALRAAGAEFVALAGKDRDGPDSYLYTGCDALAVLRETLAALEVA